MSRSLAFPQGTEACGLASRSRKRCSKRAFSASVSVPSPSHLSQVNLWRGGWHFGLCGGEVSTIGTHRWGLSCISEATSSGSAREWKTVAGYWRAQFDSKLLAARKFNHVLIVPEESRPIFFQALSTLNKPALVNESENSLRAK